jgi:hypothetical protein
MSIKQLQQTRRGLLAGGRPRQPSFIHSRFAAELHCSADNAILSGVPKKNDGYRQAGTC